MAQRGFRPHINDARPLRPENPAARDRLFHSQANTLAIPGIGRKIDHPHDGRFGIEPEHFPVNGKLPHPGGEGVAVGLGQLGQKFEREHGARGGNGQFARLTALESVFGMLFMLADYCDANPLGISRNRK